MGATLAVILVILIFLLIECRISKPEGLSLEFPGFDGTYALTPLIEARGNWATQMKIISQRPANPDYLDLIITYRRGQIITRTNSNVGNVWSHYDSYKNVQYLGDPSQLQYQVDFSTGVVLAMTKIVRGNNVYLEAVPYRMTRL